MISRAPRAVSPILGQVSDEEDVQAIEGCTSDDEEQTMACYTGLMTSLKLRERCDNSVDNVMHLVLPEWRKCNNVFARNSRTGAGANTVCLVAESAPNIDEEILVKFQ